LSQSDLTGRSSKEEKSLRDRSGLLLKKEGQGNDGPLRRHTKGGKGLSGDGVYSVIQREGLTPRVCERKSRGPALKVEEGGRRSERGVRGEENPGGRHRFHFDVKGGGSGAGRYRDSRGVCSGRGTSAKPLCLEGFLFRGGRKKSYVLRGVKE